MNFLLKFARGEWFVWQAGDDLLPPKFLLLASQAILECHEDNLDGYFSSFVLAANPSGVFLMKPKRVENESYDVLDSCGIVRRAKRLCAASLATLVAKI